jgi:hypothetical protein
VHSRRRRVVAPGARGGLNRVALAITARCHLLPLPPGGRVAHCLRRRVALHPDRLQKGGVVSPAPAGPYHASSNLPNGSTRARGWEAAGAIARAQVLIACSKDRRRSPTHPDRPPPALASPPLEAMAGSGVGGSSSGSGSSRALTVAELEGVLGHVVRALEHEDNRETFAATACYHQARSQLEALVEQLDRDASAQQGLVLELCSAFLSTYSQRIQARPSLARALRALGSQARLQLTAPAAPRLLQTLTSGGAADAAAAPSEQHQRQQQQEHHQQQQNQQQNQQQELLLRVACAHGRDCLAQADSYPGQAQQQHQAQQHQEQLQQQGSAEWMDVLDQCQREVSGGLDDVAGLE